MTTHPLVSVKKQRYGFGSWRNMRTYKCQETHKDVKLWQNWQGAKPAGGILCPHCGKLLEF